MIVLELVQTYAQAHPWEFLIVFLCLALLSMILAAISLAAMQRKHAKQNNRQTFKENIGGNKTNVHNAGHRV